MLLQRYFINIEHVKSTRNRFTIIVNGACFGIAAFVLKTPNIPSTQLQAYLIATTIAGFSVVGVLLLAALHKFYLSIISDIYYLYKKMGIDGEDFHRIPLNDRHRRSIFTPFWTLLYLTFPTTGIISVISIFLD